jgi:hypothetical protein
VDLTQGLVKPEAVSLWGVWSGVAVIAYSYGDPTSWPTSLILRGFDIDTGWNLWTLDTLPDGTFFTQPMANALAESGGRLALSLPVEATQMVTGGGVETMCSGQTYLLILDLRTGELDASTVAAHICEVTFTDEQTIVASLRQGVVAYEDGIVVVERTWGSLGATESVSLHAFADTDLDHELWTREDAPPAADTNWYGSPTLPAGWVRSQWGPYVGLADGRVASPAFPGPASGEQVIAAGDLVLEEITSLDAGSGLRNLWVDALAAWVSPAADAPVWTYVPDPGWVISWVNDPVGTAATLMVREEYMVDYAVTAARLTGVNRRSGSVLWSQPLAFSPTDVGTMTRSSVDAPTNADGAYQVGSTPGSTPYSLTAQMLNWATLAAVTAGGRDYGLFFATDGLYLVDAATGELRGPEPTLASDPLTDQTVYQCGEDRACVLVTGTERPQIVVVALPSLEVLGTDRVVVAGGGFYPAGDGLVGLITYPEYGFLRLGGG